MAGKPISILCTRPVDAHLIKDVQTRGIELDVIPFIQTEAVVSIDIQQEVEQAGIMLATVVFTSMNAVDAVTSFLDGHVPQWDIYCMGHKTKQLVAEYFGETAIAGTADNASELAELIIEHANADEVTFFCGNQRRQELPQKLEAQGISVTEIVVYETLALEHKLKKTYNGVLFFSPSAVESFFHQNKLPAETIVFAIGDTTKKTISQFCNNRIIVSKQPGKDKLVTEAITILEKHS